MADPLENSIGNPDWPLLNNPANQPLEPGHSRFLLLRFDSRLLLLTMKLEQVRIPFRLVTVLIFLAAPTGTRLISTHSEGSPGRNINRTTHHLLGGQCFTFRRRHHFPLKIQSGRPAPPSALNPKIKRILLTKGKPFVHFGPASLPDWLGFDCRVVGE